MPELLKIIVNMSHLKDAKKKKKSTDPAVFNEKYFVELEEKR